MPASHCVLKEAFLAMDPQPVAGWPSSHRGLLQSWSLLGGQVSPRWWRQSWESLLISEGQCLGLARLLGGVSTREGPHSQPYRRKTDHLGEAGSWPPGSWERGRGWARRLLRGAEGALGVHGTQRALPSVSLLLFACAHWGSHICSLLGTRQTGLQKID